MFHRFRRRFMALLLVLGLAFTLPSPAAAQTNPAELAQAIEAIENLDALRSGLASTLEGRTEPPTVETMKQVCKPVGMQAKQLSQANGWQVKQVASKYRNPSHAPATPAESMALAKFEQDPELTGFWERNTVDDQAGTHYFRRINVEASCLACHGRQGSRPQFVKENYPQDLAYDFNVGDFRGMYGVFLPDVQQALEAALSES